MFNFSIEIDEETFQDLINIQTGLFAPLDGFMGRADYQGCVDDMLLADGKTVWTIPITFDVEEAIYSSCRTGDDIGLYRSNKLCAKLTVTDNFEISDGDLFKVFKTLDDAHPGVKKEHRRSSYRLGGKIELLDKSLLEAALNPVKTRAYFKKMGWGTVAGFQTRNPIHNAHEHLQRLALEICDGLFINPITGWKKAGDFTEEAVSTAYKRIITEFYPRNRVYFDGLKTQMRYAGPREAIFHAIIRKNLGCTHFIIGRDHAGVGGFYGAYDAHALAREILEQYDIGIQLLLFNEPYYCSKCGFVTSNRACSHEHSHRTEISGTIIRECLKSAKRPPLSLMRPEIFESLVRLDKIFIE